MGLFITPNDIRLASQMQADATGQPYSKVYAKTVSDLSKALGDYAAKKNASMAKAELSEMAATVNYYAKTKDFQQKLVAAQNKADQNALDALADAGKLRVGAMKAAVTYSPKTSSLVQGAIWKTQLEAGGYSQPSFAASLIANMTGGNFDPADPGRQVTTSDKDIGLITATLEDQVPGFRRAIESGQYSLSAADRAHWQEIFAAGDEDMRRRAGILEMGDAQAAKLEAAATAFRSGQTSQATTLLNEAAVSATAIDAEITKTIGSEASLATDAQARFAKALKTDPEYQRKLDELADFKEQAPDKGLTEYEKLGMIVMDPKFQMWAKDNGYTNGLGRGVRQPDGTMAYASGKLDVIAVKQFSNQMTRKPELRPNLLARTGKFYKLDTGPQEPWAKVYQGDGIAWVTTANGILGFPADGSGAVTVDAVVGAARTAVKNAKAADAAGSTPETQAALARAEQDLQDAQREIDAALASPPQAIKKPDGSLLRPEEVGAETQDLLIPSFMVKAPPETERYVELLKSHASQPGKILVRDSDGIHILDDMSKLTPVRDDSRPGILDLAGTARGIASEKKARAATLLPDAAEAGRQGLRGAVAAGMRGMASDRGWAVGESGPATKAGPTVNTTGPDLAVLGGPKPPDLEPIGLEGADKVPAPLPDEFGPTGAGAVAAPVLPGMAPVGALRGTDRNGRPWEVEYNPVDQTYTVNEMDSAEMVRLFGQVVRTPHVIGESDSMWPFFDDRLGSKVKTPGPGPSATPMPTPTWRPVDDDLRAPTLDDIPDASQAREVPGIVPGMDPAMQARRTPAPSTPDAQMAEAAPTPAGWQAGLRDLEAERAARQALPQPSASMSPTSTEHTKTNAYGRPLTAEERRAAAQAIKLQAAAAAAQVEKEKEDAEDQLILAKKKAERVKKAALQLASVPDGDDLPDAPEAAEAEGAPEEEIEFKPSQVTVDPPSAPAKVTVDKAGMNQTKQALDLKQGMDTALGNDEEGMDRPDIKPQGAKPQGAQSQGPGAKMQKPKLSETAAALRKKPAQDVRGPMPSATITDATIVV